MRFWKSFKTSSPTHTILGKDFSFKGEFITLVGFAYIALRIDELSIFRCLRLAPISEDSGQTQRSARPGRCSLVLRPHTTAVC